MPDFVVILDLRDHPPEYIIASCADVLDQLLDADTHDLNAGEAFMVMMAAQSLHHVHLAIQSRDDGDADAEVETGGW